MEPRRRTETDPRQQPTVTLPQERAQASSHRRRGHRGSATAWLLFLVALGAGGGAAYWLWGQLRGARAREIAASDEARACRARAAEVARRAQDAETQLAAAHTDLGAVRGELAAARQSFESERGQLSNELASARARAQAVEQLQERLRAALGTNGEMHDEGDGRVTLQLVDRVLFNLGEAELTPQGQAVLDQIAPSLQQFDDKQIWVQGHTDDTPIRHTERFASNWELSTARALSVVHYLQDHAHMDPHRLAAVGFGPYRPLSSRHESRNRRIEIVLLPRTVRLVQR